MAQSNRVRPLEIDFDGVPVGPQFYKLNIDGCVDAERRRQIEKFGYQYIPFPVWVQILLEEFGETIQDYLDGKDPITEGIEVAAVAVAMIENMAIAGCNPEISYTTEFYDKIRAFELLSRCVAELAELGRTLMERECNNTVSFYYLERMLNEIQRTHHCIAEE